MRRIISIATLASLVSAIAFPAMAGKASDQLDQLNVPYGARSIDDDRTTFNPSTRDANGNRVIINGRFVNGDVNSIPWARGGSRTGFQSINAQAIGNQLNVVTSGRWNTVIIDYTQINNGQQQVSINETPQELNGSITLSGAK